MAAIVLTEVCLADVKKALVREKSNVRSSHLTEALAAALRRRTHASLRSELPGYRNDPPIEFLDHELFDQRLQELGYRADPKFRFEHLSDVGLIPTLDPNGLDIEYKGDRAKAWRNLMVCATNAALGQKLFTLHPNDNRWPTAGQEACLFDFTKPNGLPARGYVSDISYSELSIHVAVNPKGDLVRAANAGFHPGDAFAAGWLERQRGAWLQTATSMFNCRRTLLKSLASMTVQPCGYGDRGRVIM